MIIKEEDPSAEHFGPKLLLKLCLFIHLAQCLIFIQLHLGHGDIGILRTLSFSQCLGSIP